MEIVLHLGAHKTASTYLQSRLENSVKALNAAGINIAVPSTLRPGKRPAPGSGVGKMIQRWSDKRRYEIVADHITMAERAGCRRLILSDENFLGTLTNVIRDGQFYDPLTLAMRPVLRGLEGRPVTVLLAIRDYRSYFVSAYGQILRRGDFVDFDDTLKSRLLGLSRGWPGVVRDLETILPEGSRVRLWDYDDMARSESEIIAAFVGPENVDLVEPYHFHPLPGPSERAIHRLTQLRRRGEVVDGHRVGVVLKTFGKPKGHAPFDPWTPIEAQFLDDRYARDLSWMQANRMDLFLTARAADSVVPLPSVRELISARDAQGEVSPGLVRTLINQASTYIRPPEPSADSAGF